MTIKNRAKVVLRVEEFYEKNEDTIAFRGTPRKEAEEYAMEQCEIDEVQAKNMVTGIAKRVRGKIIMPNCTSKSKKGDNVKELVKASNAHNAQLKKEWIENDYAADPEKYHKRRRDFYATNEDYADNIKQYEADKRKKRRHAKEENLCQASKAVRDLGEEQTRNDVLQQVYKARPDTRNAQVLLKDRFTIFHVTQVAPHELKPAGLLVPFDSRLEMRLETRKKKKKKNYTEAELKAYEKVWGTPVSLQDACYGFKDMHGGSKVIRNKDFYVYAIVESHPQYETFYQHTVAGMDVPKNGTHFVWSLECIAVGESDPGVAVLRIPWRSDGQPDFDNVEVMYCNAGE
jgi:hypothetical protein